MKKIGIFGGSFDPVHLGHMQVAKVARKVAGLDEVCFMPCWVSPFKERTFASGEDRVAMLNLAIEDAEVGQWASASDFEISRHERSYSWQTVEHLCSTAEDTIWYWILGTDQWSEIHNWAEPEKLRTQLSFIVVTRGGDKVVERSNWCYQTAELDHEASSTKIREDFDQYSAQFLPDSVRKYCLRKKLYQ